MASNCLHTEDWEAHLEIVHPVDHVEEGEGEWEEDPRKAVDLRCGVERPAGQHRRLLPLLPARQDHSSRDRPEGRYLFLNSPIGFVG